MNKNINYKDIIFSPAKKSNPTNLKNYFFFFFKVIKILLFIIFIISFLFGFIQMFADSAIATTGGDGQIHPGTAFEIVFKEIFIKGHYFFISDKKYYEIFSNTINNWREAFTKTHYSPFYGLFVYPLAAIIVLISQVFRDNIILSLVIVTFLIKTLTLIFTFNSQKKQDKMNYVQAKVEGIQNKYKDSKDPLTKQKMQTEIISIYRKEGINPLSMFANIFLTFPFLYGMFVVIRSAHYIKNQIIFGIPIISSPSVGMWTKSWLIYLLIIIFYVIIQIVTFFLPIIFNKILERKNVHKKTLKSGKKQIIFQSVFTIIFLFVIWNVPIGVSIYWIISGFFQIMQIIFFHFYKIFSLERKKKEKKNLLKMFLGKN